MKSQKIKLQKLTLKGMEKLERDLEKYREENNPHINISHYESDEINSIEIDKNKSFDNKLSVGKYFLHAFPESFQPCIRTWNWLSVLYYRQLLNTNGKIGELRRLFVSENYSRYPYRHLLKAPYDICRFYKDNLDEMNFFLMDPVNINGELYNRIAENQDIRKNPTFLKVARRLFYDETTKSVKRRVGATKAIIRLIKVWKQYERSFDMYRMPSETAVRKLLVKHDEFAKFIHGSNKVFS